MLLQSRATKHRMKISEINKSLKDLYEVKPVRIYSELIIYALISWSMYILAISQSSLFFLLVSGIFFYRGLSFIHEISHLCKSYPKIQSLYNFLFGYPNKVPAYSMKTHRYHHSVSTFGELEDPEYEKWTEKPKYFLARPLILSFFYPLFLALRFSVWPIANTLLPKKIKMKTYKNASSFVMNLKYIRPYNKSEFNEVIKEDLMCLLYSIVFILVTIGFDVLLQAFIYWYMIIVGISLLNTYRALVAHRYTAHRMHEDDMQIKQLKDSVTIEGGFFTEIWAPVGLRYHSTHHMLPQLPYYSLAKAHKRLKKILPKDHPYHQTIEKSFLSAFTRLVKSCGVSS